MEWYCYKTEYGKAAEAMERFWNIIYNKSQELSSLKIYYRMNQGVITEIYGNTGKELVKQIGDNPFYRNMNIFTVGSEVVMNYADTPEDRFCFEVVHRNSIWYEINPKDVSEIINPYENGNINLIIVSDDADIKNWEYYINCFESDDCEYMLAFNTGNVSQAELIISESGFDFYSEIITCVKNGG